MSSHRATKRERRVETRPSEIGLPGAVSAPVVSVVIPCYNQARFLGDAIYSALHQTYERVEVVVVDDGSNDGTEEVSKWEGWRGAVRYVRQENRGLSVARNVGFQASTGAYIAFLDSDDKLLPEAIELGVQAFRERPESGMVVGYHREFTEAGAETRDDVEQLHTYLGRLRESAAADPYAALLRGNHMGMPAAVLYRRDVLEASGGFDPGLRACEDYDLYLRIARRYPVHYHASVVALYRKHSGSMSRDPSRMLRTSLEVLRRQRAHVRHHAGYVRARQEGVAFWRVYYGAALLRRLAAFGEDEDRSWGEAARASIVLARHAPGLLWENRSALTPLLLRGLEGVASGLRHLSHRVRAAGEALRRALAGEGERR